MFFCKTITIPAQTYDIAPYSERLKIGQGIIRKLWIRWRYGSGNLCGVRIKYAEFQYWPLTMTAWIPSSIHPLEFDEQFPITTEPYELKVECYNNDDVYTHDLWIACLVVKEAIPEELMSIVEYMRSRR